MEQCDTSGTDKGDKLATVYCGMHVWDSVKVLNGIYSPFLYNLITRGFWTGTEHVTDLPPEKLLSMFEKEMNRFEDLTSKLGDRALDYFSPERMRELKLTNRYLIAYAYLHFTKGNKSATAYETRAKELAVPLRRDPPSSPWFEDTQTVLELSMPQDKLTEWLLPQDLAGPYVAAEHIKVIHTKHVEIAKRKLGELGLELEVKQKP